ncbi:MAG TPA: oligosaccharide flippase family protein [Dehalococcoidia bacterium]|nr:oligosaccharide flippase family protein [Dehalococcoidia bacterium]
MQSELPRASSSGFLFNVNLVFLSQIAIYGLAFVLRVLLARGLGDEGLGTYSLFFVAILVAGGVGNLGIGLGVIYYLNKGSYSLRALFSASIAAFGVVSVLGWVVIGLWGLTYGPELFVGGRTYWLYAAALPAIIGYVIFTSFLHGESRFPALIAVAVTQGSIAAIGAAALLAADELTVGSAIAIWSASFLIADVVTLALIGPANIDWRRVFMPPVQVLRELIKYGAQGQAANMAALANYRLDLFFVAAFVSTAGAGHYAVATGLAESVWWISSAVSLVLLPRLTAMDKESADEVTPIVARNTLLVSVVASLVLVAISPLAIQLLFGGDFYPEAFLPLVLLMPGIVAGSATRVLGSYLFSQGKIIYTTFATFLALGVTIAADLVLIPLLEVEGAAIASSIAYICALIATVYWYRGQSGRRAAEALLPRPSDIGYYTAAWRKVSKRT